MNPEIRDIILRSFNLVCLTKGTIPNGVVVDCLNCKGFYFTQQKNSLTVGRQALGSDVTFTFHNATLTGHKLNCSITIAIGVRKITENNLWFIKDTRLDIKDYIGLHVRHLIKDTVYGLQNNIDELGEFEMALEGKLDKELFEFIEQVKNTFHKLDYRNTSPTELFSYTQGIPALKFSRNNEGSITIEVSSFVDESKPYTLVGDMSTISNLRICIKNEFGIFKKERMNYHESELNRTFNRIDHVDAQ